MQVAMVLMEMLVHLDLLGKVVLADQEQICHHHHLVLLVVKSSCHKEFIH